MKVQFNSDLKTEDGTLVARTFEMGNVIAELEANLTGKKYYRVKLDEPFNLAYPEVIVALDGVWTEAVKTEGAMSIDRSVHQKTGDLPPANHKPAREVFDVKTVSIEDVDIAGFEQFRRECADIGGGVTAPQAMAYALKAMSVSGGLMSYKAMIEFTIAESHRGNKLTYSKIVTTSQGGSQDKREAEAFASDGYQTGVRDEAKLLALSTYITDAFEFCNKMYYLFKAVYQGESKVPYDAQYPTR